MDSKSTASNQQNDSENPFAIKKWKAVGLWSWDVAYNDDCPICKVSLVNRCLGCQGNAVSECVVVWGECNHVFHNCCISVWVAKTSKSSCPVCQQSWSILRTAV
ncbi:hypothetical protein Pcinc_017574 [Petrolisthes cinctipes]|uniref:RING-type domain-containing protein n=1 Tax=Petrolisthes cinctipes TaxID=88211 RepID=A0AAE1FR62_PETCI|nr:hypothetical protein Pcinc_017574 [Petrolisthes cinctipes]